MTEPAIHTGVDDVHAHPHKTGHSRLDLIIALSAISISVISLFVAIAHGRTEEKLVAANSWPFPVYVTQNLTPDAGGHALVLRVENGGVGPARIQSIQVRYRSRLVHSRAELMQSCCGLPMTGPDDEIKAGLISENPIVGVLPAREGVNFLAWREQPDNHRTWAALNAARTQLVFSACYCSVLEECWRSDLSPTGTPQKVPRCKPSRDDYVG